MPINSISPWSFDGLFSLRPILEKWVGEAVDWFANDHGNILGIVVHAEDMKRWGYVLFGRDGGGGFGLLDLRMNHKSWRAAEVALLFAMDMAEAKRLEMIAQQRQYNWPQ